METSYEVEKEAYTLNTIEALGIDLGTASNLLACVDTNGNSFLVDLRTSESHESTIQQAIAQRKKGKPQDYWDRVCDAITRKRNNQMRDMVNKSVKLAVLHCIKHGLGTLVTGWNKGIKNESNMGKRENKSLFRCHSLN